MTGEAEPDRSLNCGYRRVFGSGRMTIGVVAPIEAYPAGPIAAMTRHVERIQLAEALGFAAVWLRDVPFDVPSFGDAGQLFDPFVYLGLLAASTETIGLGVASIVLPLRHPAHVAKAAASVDVLSGGRLLLGVASGDRPDEYPAMNVPFADRGERFRDAYDYLRRMADDRPRFENGFGVVGGGIDLLPKPTASRLPLLITGSSRQDPAWIAGNGDGWMTYPRPVAEQASVVRDWRARVDAAGAPPKAIMQPLYIDLLDDPDAPAVPIHLGFRSGVRALREHLLALAAIGIDHVALNLRFNRADVETTLEHLAGEILPAIDDEEPSP